MTNIERVYNTENNLTLIDLFNNLIEERINNYTNLILDEIFINDKTEEVA